MSRNTLFLGEVSFSSVRFSLSSSPTSDPVDTSLRQKNVSSSGKQLIFAHLLGCTQSSGQH